MIILISPSKTMDLENAKSTKKHEYILNEQTHALRKLLLNLSLEELSLLYKSSDQIVTQANLLNKTTSKYHAIDLFTGAVFKNLDYKSLDTQPQKYIRKHVHIFSGLYGLVPSSEAIRPYRYDLNNTLPKKISNMTPIFKTSVTAFLLSAKDKLILDLASTEYRRLIDYKQLLENKKQVISCEFKDNKKGTYKSLGTYAKMARGQFLRQLALSNASSISDIKAIVVMDYRFNPELSSEFEFIFTR